MTPKKWPFLLKLMVGWGVVSSASLLYAGYTGKRFLDVFASPVVRSTGASLRHGPGGATFVHFHK